ncbi:hypothetical protein Nmel_005056 [Mimus melanotis]
MSSILRNVLTFGAFGDNLPPARLHLSRYDTSPLLRLQPLLIMLLVFHGTLVWKYSSLLPRNVSFCWKQFHIHSTCLANQQQLVLEAESPPV